MRTIPGRTVLPLILALTQMAACGDATAGAAVAAIVRDSAGIEIVENDGYAWGEGEGWRVADTPEVDIGLVEGDPMYQLFRVTAATRLVDEGIAVANGGTGEIRLYDGGGRFLRAVGGAGEGPGEFRRLGGLWPYRGDSLVAWDPALRRITVAHPSGTIARQAQLQGNASNPELVGPLTDGSLVLSDERFHISGSGVEQQFMELTHQSADGAFRDSVGRFPFMKTFRVTSGGGAMVSPPTFAARTALTVSGSQLLIGEAVRAEIVVLAPDGRILRILRWPDGDRAVRAEDIERFKAHRLEGAKDADERRRIQSHYETVPFETHFPAYQRILADRGGHLWVQLFGRPGHHEGARWLVFDPDGQALGEVTTSEGLRILEIGDNYLLGVERDELHVEHVRLYPLLKI